MKKVLLSVTIVLTILLFAGCGAKKDVTTEAPSVETTEPVTTEEVTTQKNVYADYTSCSEDALNALLDIMEEEQAYVYVYKDFSDSENHFTQKSLMAGSDQSLVHDMDENWQENPYSGTSCIRCTQDTVVGDWGGWLFLNGYLPEGSTDACLNDGSVPGQGLDLSNSTQLSFYARGEEGGETVEFFTCGFGYDGEYDYPLVDYPDSSYKQTLGFVELTTDWEEYTIDFYFEDLSYIVCGFGYVLSGDFSGNGSCVFYLDDIRFDNYITDSSKTNFMLRSYDTDSIYTKNAAFTYDNALAALAFISEGLQEEAEEILDSFVYAVENDRFASGRIRNAYAAGDITPFPGWGNSARLPGWYDTEAKTFYEDRYQVGCNVGNTSYAALALLQYDYTFGCNRYQSTSVKLMDWVLDNCSSETPGFTAGYDGWQESGEETTYLYTYKSIEHNIDAYAAFKRLYDLTGEQRFADGAENALEFIKSMYDEKQGLFFTGTTEDGVTPSTENIVLDAQVWSCLALGKEYEPYKKALDVVAEMETEDGGYPFCKSNANGGFWSEGTAFTALMYKTIGDDEKATSALEALKGVQLYNGLFPAATVDNLSTGIWLFTGEPWEYSKDAHIAPTAWLVMAVNGFNPYSFEKK